MKGNKVVEHLSATDKIKNPDLKNQGFFQDFLGWKIKKNK